MGTQLEQTRLNKTLQEAKLNIMHMGQETIIVTPNTFKNRHDRLHPGNTGEDAPRKAQETRHKRVLN